MRSFLFLISLLVVCLSLGSCGKDKQEETDKVIISAKILLTTKKCQEAINVLESHGRDTKHAKYLQTLASAYACKSDFTATNFIGNELTKMTSTQAGFLGSLTSFSTSEMTAPTDAKYESLKEPINILLYAGGVDTPSATERAGIFTKEEADDINIQNIYFLLTQLGKYIFYYGNANPTLGRKGTGTVSNGNPNNLTNGCFYLYNPFNPVLATLISAARFSGSLGSCTMTATGHPLLLPLPNVLTVKRMCEGVVLFNNLVDLLSNTTMPGNGKSLTTLYSTVVSVCTNNTFTGDICNVKSQSVCETTYATIPQTDKLQAYFFIIFETLFI